ncbi:MAG: zinc ABC transporter substrate-binding protein, partial [Pseudomonadota bacterium]
MKLNTMQSLAFSSSFLAMSIGAGSALADVPNVAVDIAPVHGLVSMVMGDLGQPNLILPQNASPHGFAMRPADARALHSADLVFWTSPELTPWLVRALESRPSEGVLPPLMENPDIVTFTFRDNPLFEHDDHGHEEHAEAGHDDHGHEEHAEAAHDDHGHEEHADAGHDDHDHEEHAEAGHDDHDHEEHAEAGHDDHDHEEHTEAGHDDQDHEEHADAGHDDHDH